MIPPLRDGGLHTYRDPVSGALVPGGLHVRIENGIPIYSDSRQREVKISVSKTSDNIVYVASTQAQMDGFTVVTHFSPSGDRLSTDIRINNNPTSVEFSDAGGILGQQLGFLLEGSDQLTRIAASAALQTLGNNLGDGLDGLVGNTKPE